MYGLQLLPQSRERGASTVTDSRGEFLIAGLATGNYKAQAQAPGFNTTLAELNFDASRPLTYNFMLNVGSVSETVEVSTQNTRVQTENATVGGPVANATVSQVPPNGRNYAELISSATCPNGLSVPKALCSARSTKARAGRL